MGDSEEVMEFGKKLNMNPMEQKKYKYHIETIKINERQTKKWKAMNYFWQMIFFGTLFIEAIAILFLHVSDAGYFDEEQAKSISTFIRSWFFLLFGFLMPFSFPFMMWSGVVRGKWEGKLTRSAAYALSFLENIEHRQFLEEKQKVRPLAQVKTTPGQAKAKVTVKGPPKTTTFRVTQ